MKNRIIVSMLIALWSLFSGLAIAGKNNKPDILFPDSKAYGKSYGAWAGEFNNWIWQFPLAEFPLFAEDGSNCGQGQKGKVWFLAGGFGVVDREGCEIPKGKAIFVSVASFLSFAPLFGEDEAEVRADALTDVGLVYTDTLTASLDGNPINNITNYLAESPEGGFVFTIPEGSILNDPEVFGLEADDYDPAVAAGYYLMLAPLEFGEHVLQWSAAGENQAGEPYSWDVTYRFTVVGDDE